MFDSKYSNFLTILLIVVIVAILGIIGFLGFKYYESIKADSDAANFVDSYINNKPTQTNTSTDTNTDLNSALDGINGTTSNTSSGGTTQTYKGFTTVGTIEIPKTGVSYPIISDKELSKTAIEVAFSMLYGPGPNQVGNTVIIGHNLRNGQFFSNNKKLVIGDKVYITDGSGQRLSYTIYNKYETTDTDTEYITRETNGAREISLSTCTDDSSARLIIWAKCDLDK